MAGAIWFTVLVHTIFLLLELPSSFRQLACTQQRQGRMQAGPKSPMSSICEAVRGEDNVQSQNTPAEQSRSSKRPASASPKMTLANSPLVPRGGPEIRSSAPEPAPPDVRSRHGLGRTSRTGIFRPQLNASASAADPESGLSWAQRTALPHRPKSASQNDASESKAQMRSSSQRGSGRDVDGTKGRGKGRRGDATKAGRHDPGSSGKGRGKSSQSRSGSGYGYTYSIQKDPEIRSMLSGYTRDLVAGER